MRCTADDNEIVHTILFTRRNRKQSSAKTSDSYMQNFDRNMHQHFQTYTATVK